MTIYDVSVSLSENMAIYPNDPRPCFEHFSKISEGNIANNTFIKICLHIGTHVDAPFHFFENGRTLDTFPLDYFLGECRIIEVFNPECITKEELSTKDIKKDEILLIKTKNSSFVKASAFRCDFTYVSPPAAEFLAEKQIKTLGIDYFTVDPIGSKDFPAHKALLGAEIPIIEGLCLSDVPEGEYFLSALPLKFEAENGSPVRAILYI